MDLDELIFDALIADDNLVEAVGSRIESTCFEVSPSEQDNTQLPCIIVTDDGLVNQPSDKDSVWESNIDRVQASVEVDGRTPKEVKRLIRMARRAVSNRITSLSSIGEETPNLVSTQTDGVAWDWMKPCYHETITYVCDILSGINDG